MKTHLPIPQSDASTSDDDCDGCALHDSRREFLQRVSLALGGIALTLIGRGAGAAELPVRYAGVLARSGGHATYPVPASDGATIDKANEVILVRWKESMYAFALSCPHQRTALKWKKGDDRFQCPKHKSKYQPDGTFIEGKATRGMDRYAIRRDGGNVLVDLAALYRQDKAPAQWAAALVKI